MRLIDADALVENLTDKAKGMAKIAESSCGQAADYYSGIKTGFANSAIVADSFPTIDAVPVGAYEQTRWERDTAISQLAEIGKSLCEKMDDIVPKKGKWIKPSREDGLSYDERAFAECSVCGRKEYLGWDKAFCPNCGARMTE